MPSGKQPFDPGREARFLADVNRDRALREKGYREQALRLYPHVCGRCSREFSGKRLRELTVHHKDNDHLNNPPDGSNWELLCLYCHDNEHETPEQRDYSEGPATGSGTRPTLSFRAFEGLKDLLPPRNDEATDAPPEDT